MVLQIEPVFDSAASLLPGAEHTAARAVPAHEGERLDASVHKCGRHVALLICWSLVPCYSALVSFRHFMAIPTQPAPTPAKHTW